MGPGGSTGGTGGSGGQGPVRLHRVLQTRCADLGRPVHSLFSGFFPPQVHAENGLHVRGKSHELSVKKKAAKSWGVTGSRRVFLLGFCIKQHTVAYSVWCTVAASEPDGTAALPRLGLATQNETNAQSEINCFCLSVSLGKKDETR